MLKNYFKIAWRNILRNKTFSLIKIAGLALGLAVCLLILLYTKDEVSFDRFHEKGKDIYRVVQTMKFGADPARPTSVTQPPLGVAYKQGIPEIATCIRVNEEAVIVRKGKDVFDENPLFADKDLFNTFSFPLLKGNPESVLNDPHSIVLTEETALKYFGNTDVIGKAMEIKMHDAFELFTVTGLAKATPQNSTIKFSMVIPFSYYMQGNSRDGWIGGSINTFLLLHPNAVIPEVVKKMQAIFNEHTREQIAKAKQEQNISIEIKQDLQPLSSVHLNPELGAFNGLQEANRKIYSYILGAIAVFILLMACINFINLAIGQSLKRGKEIGIRKVIGGTRKQLIGQFLTESFLVSLFAFLIAIGIALLALPFFNELSNKKLSLAYLSDFRLYAGLFALLLVTTFIAGSYPAFVLSAFQPVKVLYNKQKLLGRNFFTKGLIVLQFGLAIFLIICAVAINAQVNFLTHQDLGYNSKNLVKIDLPFSKGNNQLVVLLKQELKSHPNIINIATRNRGRMGTGVKSEGKEIFIDYNRIDDRFFPSFQIPIIAGRNFSTDFPADQSRSVVVNEALVKAAGWKPGEAIGKSLVNEETNAQLTIVGVIRNYHYGSLKEEILPQVFSQDSSQSYGQIWLKLSGNEIPKTLSDVETTYKRLAPFNPYSYNFLEEVNAKNYEEEAKWKNIMDISSVLFIFISCIGLLGLVILSIEQRTKEIGIRKVLGAAVSKIVLLISKEFIVLISIAFLIAMPLGYWAVFKWLQNFPYRISIQWWMFAFAGLLMLTIALITLSTRAIRAATGNPIKALRTE